MSFILRFANPPPPLPTPAYPPNPKHLQVTTPRPPGTHSHLPPCPFQTTAQLINQSVPCVRLYGEVWSPHTLESTGTPVSDEQTTQLMLNDLKARSRADAKKKQMHLLLTTMTAHTFRDMNGKETLRACEMTTIFSKLPRFFVTSIPKKNGDL